MTDNLRVIEIGTLLRARSNPATPIVFTLQTCHCFHLEPLVFFGHRKPPCLYTGKGIDLQ